MIPTLEILYFASMVLPHPLSDSTGSNIRDTRVLPDLYSQIPIDEEIGLVTAGRAYVTCKCYDAIANRSAHAVIPSRKNAKLWKTVTSGAAVRSEALRAAKYLGPTLCRPRSEYHRRSRVKTKMHCVKLLGKRVIAWDLDRLVAEFQVRIAVLNGLMAPSAPVTQIDG